MAGILRLALGGGPGVSKAKTDGGPSTDIDDRTEDVQLGHHGGNGYNFEAAEVGRCLRAGLTESPVVTLDESLDLMRILDELRRQVGLRYPMEGSRKAGA